MWAGGHTGEWTGPGVGAEGCRRVDRDQRWEEWGAADFFLLVKEEYNQVFCIQNVVQYFGMGHLCV